MSLFSWGMYPKIKNKKTILRGQTSLLDYINQTKEFIPFGNGRSYGDSAINEDILYCKEYNNFLKFDEQNGLLSCQAGVLLSEIIESFVPRGWFLKITPGTKYITLGGAIASDIHGKNHHIEGCFSRCVEWFKIMLPNGKVETCKPNSELFLATCGGMGLTGVILEATISLKKINSQYINQTTIKNKNLQETFEAFEKYENSPYSVAWIDCLAKDNNLGRSLLMCGDFDDDGDLEYKTKRTINIPFTFPSFILNNITVKAFNWLYYSKVKDTITKQKVNIDKFFYPLDSIDNWNRIYGKAGFTQYQFILPKKRSFEGLQEILTEIAHSKKGSFLAVLKLYGEGNENYLSFPIEGYSLALDFKINDAIFELLDKLDEILVKYGGKIYLTKDVRVSKETFEKGYPLVEKFRSFRDKNDMSKKLNSLQSKRLQI